MPRIFVEGDGPLDAPVWVVGERPGEQEEQELRPFVGKSGIELFGGYVRQERPKGSGTWGDYYEMGRWERIVGIPRDQLHVRNLVETYSWKPPADWEIERDAPKLRNAILEGRPQLIVTMGAHAMRWFLGDLSSDIANGVPHIVRITEQVAHPSPDYEPDAHECVVIPVVHPAAALRQPELNQEKLSAALRNVKRFIDGKLQAVKVRTRTPVRVLDSHALLRAMAGGYDTRATERFVFFDCEGDEREPEAIQVSWGTDDVAVVYADDAKGLRLVQHVFERATDLVAHYAVTDWKTARAMGLVFPRDVRVHCTMLASFVCAGVGAGGGEEGGGGRTEPQALKDIAYRELAYDLPSYRELVQPLDDERCALVVRQAADHLDEFIRLAEEQHHAKRAKWGRVTKKSMHAFRRRVLAVPIKQHRSLIKQLANTEPGVRKRVKGSKVIGSLELPPTTWKSLPKETRETYACNDPWLTGQMWRKYSKRMKRMEVDKVYAATRSILPMLARMEEVGMRVDVDGLRAYSRRLASKYQLTCARLDDLLGYSVNPRAAEEVADAVTGTMGITLQKLVKSKKYYSTEDKYLKAHRKEHAAIDLILHARGLWKTKSSFADSIAELAKHVVAEDGTAYYVLFPNLTYTRVVTGRLSAKDPNVLAIPKHTKTGKAIRKYFIARPGCRLVSSDLSQIELRVAAHDARDPRLLAEYREGKDKHQETVDNILKRPGDKDEMIRRIAKNLNFAVLMGTTEYGFYDQLHEQGIEWTVEQCRETIAGWFEYYHHVKEFGERQIHFAKRHGYVVAPLSGRRRYVGAIHSTVPYIRDAAAREVQAFAYSTDAQFIMQTWMGRIWDTSMEPRAGRRGVTCEPWLQVHDDMISECSHNCIDEYKGELQETLPQMLDIETKTDTKVGDNWGEMAA